MKPSSFHIPRFALRAALLLLLCGSAPAAQAQGVMLRSKPQTNRVSTLANSNFIPVEIPAFGTNSTQLISVSNLLESLLLLPNWPPPGSVSGLENYSTNRNLLPSIYTNTVYVNATGATAIANGTLLTNAWKSTLQGVEFIIGPGDYYNPTGTIPSTAFSSDNRKITFLPGARYIVGRTNENADPAWNFDDSAGKVTNIWITGMGTFINSNAQVTVDVMILQNGSRVFVEHASAYNYGGGAILTFAGGSNHVDWIAKEKIFSEYDLFYFNGSDGNRLQGYVEEGETWSDLLEVTDDSPQWGLINLHFRRAICSTNSADAVELENSLAMLSGRVTLRIDSLKSTRNLSGFRSSGTTDGLIDGAGGVWEFPSGAQRGVVQQLVSSAAHTGGIHLRGAKIVWPAALDPFTLTNLTTSELTLENISLTMGAGATNWVRGATPSRVRILGALNMNRPLPVGGNITIVGTNKFSNVEVLGSLTNAGAMQVAGQFTGSGMKLTGILDVDADVYANALIVTNIFMTPYQTVPTGIEGELVFDLDHWTTGRGSLLSFDGTADIALLGVASSDTPEIGDTPRYTAAGVTTWEAPNSFTPSQISGVGGANTNFTIVLPAPESVINGFTNVSVRAVMNTDTTKAYYWSLLITNGSGTDRTFEFSAVTNRVRWSGTYGTNAPNTLTNGTQLLISGRSLGTNTVVGYSYFPWP